MMDSSIEGCSETSIWFFSMEQILSREDVVFLSVVSENPGRISTELTT